MAEVSQSEKRAQQHQFWFGILRGFGGALLFSIPILLTMEMWSLGFYIDRWHLVLMLVVMVPVLIALDRYSGLRDAPDWRQDCIDGMTAYAIGVIASALTLSLLGIVTLDMPLREIAGKIMIQAPTSAFGAVLARTQFGGGQDEKRRRQNASYWAELFFVAAGAFYVGSTVAPTEEMVMVAYRMTTGHAIALLITEVAIMHAFLYAMEFSGAPEVPKGTPGWSVFVRFTMPGYVVALAVSAYVLWTFGHIQSFDLHWNLMFMLVLGLPCAIGGAAGRLIL